MPKGLRNMCGSLHAREIIRRRKKGETFQGIAQAAGVRPTSVRTFLNRRGIAGPHGGDRSCNPEWLQRHLFATFFPPT